MDQAGVAPNSGGTEANAQPESAQPESAQTAGAQPESAQTAGAQTAGAQTAGAQTAGAQPESTQTAGAQTAAPQDTFSGLLAGLYGAVKQAQNEIVRSNAAQMAYFFPPDPASGQPNARMVSVPLPDGQGQTVLREVPLFALVPHQDLLLESVSVRMKLSLLGLLDDGGHGDVRTSLNLAGVESDSVAEIEIRLKGGDAVEGVARINDALVRQI